LKHTYAATPYLTTMKNIILFCLLQLFCASLVFSQANKPDQNQRRTIEALIDQYSKARETKDTALLKRILTNDVDQLVSTGEWRDGLDAAILGMLKSSASNPGTRTLTVDKIKMLNSTSAVVDCKYEITGMDSTARKMWSSFVVLLDQGAWKITAIRNMLPAGN
jgi:uncharacterized protein (TIGR02246 family)